MVIKKEKENNNLQTLMAQTQTPPTISCVVHHTPTTTPTPLRMPPTRPTDQPAASTRTPPRPPVASVARRETPPDPHSCAGAGLRTTARTGRPLRSAAAD